MFRLLIQTVSLGDNLHGMPESIFSMKNKKNIITLSSTEFGQRVVTVNEKSAEEIMI